MAYVLGFVFADGTITVHKNGSHYLAIQISDEDLLEKIKTAIKSEHKISKRIHKKMDSTFYRLQISNKEIIADLALLGVLPRKTARMKLPNIPEMYFGDFVRGYFDGDGNIWMGEIHKNRTTKHIVLQLSFTSCSPLFLQKLRVGLRTCGVKGGGIYHPKTANYSRLSFSTNDTLTICDLMYNGRHKLFLPRKKQVFERFVASRSKKLRA